MVHFVGAGPGAADLITVRGAALLREADLIIYAGSLVNEELLSEAKEGCRTMNSAGMTLEQVVIEMKAARGKNVVRLHTGDPSIYGAIREQMDELDKCGVSYEVVPGVSSLSAAAASLKAEYTLPGVSQSVIISRVEGRTGVPPKEDIALLAGHGATMVIFLSAGLLEELTERLIAGGYAPGTPAAIVCRASWPDEKTLRTTVSGLCETARENGVTRTALILVGHFLEGARERSKLYDPSFAHGFRESSS